MSNEFKKRVGILIIVLFACGILGLVGYVLSFWEAVLIFGGAIAASAFLVVGIALATGYFDE